MAQRFADEAALLAYLHDMDPNYGQYAQSLWKIGIRSRAELCNARHEDLTSAGALSGHASNMKIQAADERFRQQGFGSGMEGINGRQYITLREPTCCQLLQLLDQNGYVLIKAPPQSGKTALLQLLGVEAGRRGYKSLYVNFADMGTGDWQTDDMLKQRCGHTMKELLDGCQELLLLIDEAQLLYNEHRRGADFWRQLKRLERGQDSQTTTRHAVRVVLAAAYGTKRSIGPQPASLGPAQPTPPASPTSTPINPDTPQMVVTVFPALRGGASLQLLPAEMTELWENFVMTTQLGCGLAISEHIYAICGGQPGLVTFCLDYLGREMVNNVKLNPDCNAMYKLTSRNFLHQLEGVRSFLSYVEVQRDPAAMALMRKLLWMEPLDVSSDDRAVQLLCRGGQAVIGPTDQLSFTSPLHRAWFLHKHYTSRQQTCVAAHDIAALLHAVVERMDPRTLRHTESLGSKGLPLERCWQMELYRATLTVLPSHIVLSPDVGKTMGINGFADFYLPEPYRMILELTREGDRIKGHLDRFLDANQYLPLLQQSGAVDQYAVVDFRGPSQGSASSARQPQKSDVHLFTVQFGPDFETAKLWHMGKSTSLSVRGAADVETLAALRSL